MKFIFLFSFIVYVVNAFGDEGKLTIPPKDFEKIVDLYLKKMESQKEFKRLDCQDDSSDRMCRALANTHVQADRSIKKMIEHKDYKDQVNEYFLSPQKSEEQINQVIHKAKNDFIQKGKLSDKSINKIEKLATYLNENKGEAKEDETIEGKNKNLQPEVDPAFAGPELKDQDPAFYGPKLKDQDPIFVGPKLKDMPTHPLKIQNPADVNNEQDREKIDPAKIAPLSVKTQVNPAVIIPKFNLPKVAELQELKDKDNGEKVKEDEKVSVDDKTIEDKEVQTLIHSLAQDCKNPVWFDGLPKRTIALKSNCAKNERISGCIRYVVCESSQKQNESKIPTKFLRQALCHPSKCSDDANPLDCVNDPHAVYLDENDLKKKFEDLTPYKIKFDNEAKTE